MVSLGAAALTVAAALVVGSRLGGDDPSASGGPVATATPHASYVIEPEPTEVATDAPVEPTGGDVDVVLTFAGFDEETGTVQANGFAAGILEDGGTCTLTLTKGDDEVTAMSTGTADAKTTSCGLLETADTIADGTWKAVLTYASDMAEGSSPAMEVSVR